MSGDLMALAIEAHRQGRMQEAAEGYQRILAADPGHPDALHLLGLIEQDRNNAALAESLIKRALSFKDDPVYWSNLAVLYHRSGRWDEAEVLYRRVLKAGPETDVDPAVNLINFGCLLRDAGRPEEAALYFQKAAAHRPNDAAIPTEMAIVLTQAGRLDEAEAAYRHALALDPGHFNAQVNLSHMLLAQGRFGEGWPLYETRHPPGVTLAIPPPGSACRPWRGEDLTGKSLMICPEQGFGDLIQFVRYAAWLKAKGAARVTVVCPTILTALLATASGVDAAVDTLEAAGAHDYWLTILSLPFRAATTLETIPATLPYLHAPPPRLEAWRGRLAEPGFKVGLVWKGSASHTNDAHRSLASLETLAPVLKQGGVDFYSLQKGQGEDEAAHWPGSNLTPLGADITDFADTAAIVAQLDLVICVDTAIAHLAGALNRPCWVLLPAYSTDWRWLLNRADSPWYPGVMRLFRQAAPGDWDGVVARVAEVLASMVS